MLLIFTFFQDIDKKNILAVQTVRNNIMGSTLMDTISVLLCAGLAAVISSTYSVKKPLNDDVYGAHGEFMVALKYVTILTIFLFSFFCHTLSIRFLNQLSVLICCPLEPSSVLTSEYLSDLLDRGSVSQHRRKQAFLHGSSSFALDIWSSSGVLLLGYHGACSLLSGLSLCKQLFQGKGKAISKRKAE